MLKAIVRLLVGGCIAMFAVSPAFADWTMSMAPDEDGGGQPAILLGEADEGRWFQLWCRDDARRLAIIFNDGQNDEVTGETADLSFATDTGFTWSSVGDFYRHGPGWLGLSYRNLADFEAIVRDIINAEGNITATVVTPGGGMADDINVVASANGSTKAGREFAQRCFGGTPATVPQISTETTAPAPAPATDPQPISPEPKPKHDPDGPWQFADLSGDLSSRYSAQMTVAGESVDATLRIACSPSAGLLTIGVFDRRGFAGDGAYKITASVDDRTWTLARTASERSADGAPGVVSADAQVLSIIDQLSVDKQVLQIELVHELGGARRSYRFSAAGSTGPATDLYFKCRT